VQPDTELRLHTVPNPLAVPAAPGPRGTC
jgi:hypothetical protein